MTSSSSSSPEMQPAPTADTTERFTYKHATHEEVLEDLSSRFLLNLPEEEVSSLERICFQVEQAHWFYEDFVREQNPKFPSLPLKKFSAMLFHACPLLHQWSHDHEQAFNTFMQYKTRVPVCGAIMLNESWEKCILVKGWKSSSGWGFPKGKINEHEPPHECAIREVLEETGYNLAGKINPADVIEMSIKEQLISLFIVPGIPDDFPFKTRTRKEISRIEWFKLTDLPTWKRNKASPGKFYLISPFIAALKAFVTARKPSGLGARNIKATPEAAIESSPQESGSSSVDNGEPHTPSSQSSEGALASNKLSIAAHPSDDDSLSQPVDPHVARLLTSLSLSAKKTDLKPASTVPDIRRSVEISPRLAHNGTPPATHLRHTSAKFVEATHRFQHSETTLSVHANDPPFSKQGILQDTRTSSAAVAPATSSLLSYGASNESSSVVLPTSSAPPLAPLQAGATKQLPSSRRSSSIADISPYLTTPTEVPTSGKRLKQLALLELVADESSKMTPTLVSRELPTSRAYDFPPLRHPGPCASVPPSTTYESLGQRQFQHDSIGGVSGSLLPHSRGNKASSPLNQLQHSLLPDPFHTRSQSSHLDCCNPAYAPCFQAHRVVHQGQLPPLSADYSPSGRAERRASQLPVSQHSYSLPSVAYAPQYATSEVNVLPAGCPSRVSRSPLAMQATFPPLPRPPPGSVQLLSILNSGGQAGGRVPPTHSHPSGCSTRVG